ncbi:MAG: hypothetical protein NVSMB9_12320 [Isosphaeraceae bacterium]
MHNLNSNIFNKYCLNLLNMFMNVKFLESFDFGRLVVTNVSGVKGIHAVDSVHAGSANLDGSGLSGRKVPSGSGNGEKSGKGSGIRW